MKYMLIIFLISLLIDSFNCSFQFDSFNRMNKEKKEENLIISPLSIFQVLSLTANGAKGETQKEMLEVLGANDIDELNEINYNILSITDEFSTIDIANAVMTKFTPLDNFCNIAEKYLAPIEPLISVEQVNNWCSNKTHGKINKILETLDPDIVMILLNAIYFKDEWSLQFEHELTKNLSFYNYGNEEKKVETMNQIEYFNYYEDKKVQVIELRFQNDFMSAIIILPSDQIDINTYINYLPMSRDEFPTLLKQLKRAKVHLQLPKFEVNFEKELNDILIDLGMYSAFNDDADFSGLRKEGGLYISKVIHKTYLKVNEEGTEAAAVTIVAIEESAMPEEDKIYNMKVNRPFLFMLKNKRLPEDHDMVFMAKIEKIE